MRLLLSLIFRIFFLLVLLAQGTLPGVRILLASSALSAIMAAITLVHDDDLRSLDLFLVVGLDSWSL